MAGVQANTAALGGGPHVACFSRQQRVMVGTAGHGGYKESGGVR